MNGRGNGDRQSLDDLPDFARTSFARSLFVQANDSQYNAIENVTVEEEHENGVGGGDDDDGHGGGYPYQSSSSGGGGGGVAAAAARRAYRSRGSGSGSGVIRGYGATVSGNATSAINRGEDRTRGYGASVLRSNADAAGRRLSPGPTGRAAAAAPGSSTLQGGDVSMQESPYVSHRKKPQSEFARRRTMQRSSIIQHLGGDDPRGDGYQREESWMRDLQDQTSSLDPQAQAAASALLQSSITAVEAQDAALAASIVQNDMQFHEEESNNHVEEENNAYQPGNATQEEHREFARQQASQQVRRNMGYDPHQRRAAAAASSSARGGHSSKTSTSSLTMSFKGPPPSEGRPLPPPSPSLPSSIPPRCITSFRFFQHRKNDKRVPELCPGVDLNLDNEGRGRDPFPTYDNSGQPIPIRDELRKFGIGEEQIVVKCLTCRALLKAKKLASLVTCPRCSTVSPATSIMSATPQ